MGVPLLRSFTTSSSPKMPSEAYVFDLIRVGKGISVLDRRTGQQVYSIKFEPKTGLCFLARAGTTLRATRMVLALYLSTGVRCSPLLALFAWLPFGVVSSAWWKDLTRLLPLRRAPHHRRHWAITVSLCQPSSKVTGYMHT